MSNVRDLYLKAIAAPAPTQIEAAQNMKAQVVAHKTEIQQRGEDLLAFRQYRTADPWQRAIMRAQHEGAIERGRKIQTQIDTPETPPEPPKAA